MFSKIEGSKVEEENQVWDPPRDALLLNCPRRCPLSFFNAGDLLQMVLFPQVLRLMLKHGYLSSDVYYIQ